ncbi:hypothetical protein CPIN17260_1074 [Campylobacter pinnipediorum subsp. pinnipediorum]|uniref:hypothetical protein n=1 Tax=Campylobacter pinnipediorum TaxID=1965231 RepID=UPI000995B836|nr:hypothetical protein [Campylobacter pinnipediorum]AQW81363.1 hypothetical protein CPIN17260_1074 [Campylobacter pinnipediorum subsp. pinnipediorum]
MIKDYINYISYSLIVVCFLWINHLNNKIDELRYRLNTSKITNELYISNLSDCNSKIKLQNEKLKILRVDKEKLNNELIKLDDKFKKITTPKANSKCNVKLKYYEQLFKELS